MRTNITRERLAELLHYDPLTGLFIRKVRTSNRIKVGDVAGCVNPEGYVQISVDGKPFLAHRLAWLYVHKEWPQNLIDHVNGDKKDNRIANLRAANNTQNMHNAPYGSKSKTGIKGIHCWNTIRGGKEYSYWVASVRLGKGKRKIKHFPQTEDGLRLAVEYLSTLRRIHHGDFANDG